MVDIYEKDDNKASKLVYEKKHRPLPKKPLSVNTVRYNSTSI